MTFVKGHTKFGLGGTIKKIPDDYERKFPVHFWTRVEVMEMLRIGPGLFKRAVDNGYLLPLKRIDGKVVYDDWSVYRAIHFLFQGSITHEHSKQIKSQILASSRRIRHATATTKAQRTRRQKQKESAEKKENAK